MRRKGWGLLACLAAAVLAGTASGQEGYDPLRQITSQVMKANLLVLQDRTGSMAWTPTSSRSPTAGATGTGNLYWGANSTSIYANQLAGNSFPAFQWAFPPNPPAVTPPAAYGSNWNAVTFTVPSNVPPGGLGTVCDYTGTNCQVWTYVLVFEYPTRMSFVKNVFGATVDIFNDYQAPLDPSTFAGDWAKNYKVTVTRWDPTKAVGVRSPSPFWVFTIDYGKNTKRTAPGVPFNPITANKPTVDASGNCTVGTCQLSKAKNLFAVYSDRVNWGLAYFNTSSTIAVPVTPSGTPASDLTKLQDYYRAVGDTGGTSGVSPLSPSGSTATKAAFGTAKTAMTNAITIDSKVSCGRPYGVLLVTDGLSNSGNPNGGDWINPCGSVSPLMCDAGSSGYDCPSDWANFAAAKSDDMYRNTPTGVGSVKVRTWTIGVSVDVGPCELDYIAYMGRTDASSPNHDTGWGGYDPVKNPYLPNVTGSGNDTPTSTTSYPTTNSNFDGPTGQYRYFKDKTKVYDPNTTGHGHNAFFATNATDLADAIEAIVNATAAGDYATNAPTSGQSVGLGSQVVLPSTEFPGWLGHLYAFDTTLPPTDPHYLVWDAATVLPAPGARKIYTWDSSKNLVQLDTSNATINKLQTIAATYGLTPSSSLTSQVVQFILGYDVNANPAWSAPRSWILAPMINTTPAIEGRPNVFKQTTVQPHAAFEAQYAGRHPLVWAGSDDGMMHAFDFNTGIEELAILPPNLLPLQVQLYNNYVLKPQGTRLTGQPDRFSNHLYGVANSFRYADVWFQSDSTYHTVGILSEGPGGNMVAALDITHPYGGNATLGTSADPNYSASQPFSVLWSVTGGSGVGQLPGLYGSWSVPAMGPVAYSEWDLAFGGGYNPASNVTSQGNGSAPAPIVYTADLSSNPTSPTFHAHTLSDRSAPPKILVGNQAFADANVFSTMAPAFHSDNVADLALQADLNGRIWFESGTNFGTTVQVGIDASAVSGLSTQQPLYYSPAVTGYGPSSASCDIFGFGSGSLYEQSLLVTGPAIGAGTNFIPSLYIALNKKPATGNPPAVVPSANLYRIPIAGTTFSQGDPQNPNATRTLGQHTQLTASPFVISPLSGSGPVQLLFLVYDPDYGCQGNSYVISLLFDVPGNCTTPPAIPTANMIAYDAGPGAASGFAIANSVLLVSKSGLGAGSRAGLYAPPNVVLSAGSSSTVKPVWWKEHK